MDWLKKRNREQMITFVREVSEVLSAARGPLTDELNRLVQCGDFRAVVDRKIDYTDELDVEDIRGARSIQALFSKQEEDWLGYGGDPTVKALDTFVKAENHCQATNDRLASTRPNGAVSSVLFRAARKIEWVLGDCPSLQELKFSFGPGATTNVRSAEASFRAKLSASPMCSEDMLPFVGEFLAEFPYLTEHHSCAKEAAFTIPGVGDCFHGYNMSVQVGNGKLTFVPKSIKTKRPIVVEPILNGLCQKGIGGYIKDRLLCKCNLDLKDQGRNRFLAYKGSVDGSLATLDLSSASDTVSIQIVLELLPPAWVDLLGLTRTGSVDYGIQRFELSKWSSMGNAYTFELESLIFYSLAWACCDLVGASTQEVSVFGDDIIVPSESAGLLQEVLSWCGFWVNDDKSFFSGPFRESCGADWFRGCDVRPFYLKERVNDQSLFAFHNWAIRNGERDLARLIHGWTFPHNRIYGPDGYGDGHLLGSHSLRYPRRERRRGYAGGFFDTFTLNPKRLKKRFEGDWLVPQYSVYVRSGAEAPTDPTIVRGHRSYAKTSIYTLATSIFGR